MKHYPPFPGIFRAGQFLLLILLLVGTVLPSKACNFSDYTLNSVTPTASGYEIQTTLCIGGGVLGTTLGADVFTSTFAIAIYGQNAVFTGFSPDSVASVTTGCIAQGILLPTTSNVPPDLAGTGDSANAYVGFQALNSCVLTCLTTNADCGNPGPTCIQITLFVNTLPDSLLAIGIEGQGNPSSGCHRPFLEVPGTENMSIVFNPLPVTWGGFTAHSTQGGIELNWQTLNETNNDHFRIERATDSQWSPVAEIPATGNSSSLRNYSWTDPSPNPGSNYYRIVQIDIDGHSSTSDVRQALWNPPLEWELSAVHLEGEELTLHFSTPETSHVEFELVQMDGKVKQKFAWEGQSGSHKTRFPLSNPQTGVFLLRMRSNQHLQTLRAIAL